MQLRHCIVIVLATLALGAAPPGMRGDAPQDSTWGRFKSGALRLLPGGDRTNAQPLPIGQDHPVGQPSMKPDPRVRPATAVTVEPRRRGLFGRERRPQRTLSDYMAWEKP